MTIPITTWTLQGLINGERVDIAGSGHLDTTTGHMVLDLSSEAPLPDGFDLIPAQMICNVATTGFAAGTSADGFSWPNFSPEGLRVTPDRIGRVHTDAGVEVLRLSAVTTLTLRADGLHVDNMVDGIAKLPANLSLVSASETLLPHGAGRGVSLAQFLLEADGELLSGVTTSPYRFSDEVVLPTLVTRTLDFVGSTSHPHGAHIEASSAWVTLAAVGAVHA
jgi:hypothetical protein